MSEYFVVQAENGSLVLYTERAAGMVVAVYDKWRDAAMHTLEGKFPPAFMRVLKAVDPCTAGVHWLTGKESLEDVWFDAHDGMLLIFLREMEDQGLLQRAWINDIAGIYGGRSIAEAMGIVEEKNEDPDFIDQWEGATAIRSMVRFYDILNALEVQDD